MGDSTATLSLVIKAKDMASGQVSKLNKSLTTLKSGALDGLGLGFMGAAGAAAFLTGALVKGVQGAIEEEAGIAKLTAALKANVPAWDGNTAAIEDTIRARTDLGFADDELRASLAKLVPATKNVGKAFDVQAVAMDLARLKGIDLETASQALVKVEAGQYRALKDLGIVLKDGATQTEALAAVQSVAQGQAAAYMDTTAGKAELLGKRFDELAETVGAQLVPALSDGMTVALGMGDAFDMLTGKAQGDYDAISDLTAALTTFLPGGEAVRKKIEAVDKEVEDNTAHVNEDARKWDTLGESTAGYRESAKIAHLGFKIVNGDLSTMGQRALDAVNAMIDLRRESEFLWDNGRGNGDKPKSKPKPGTTPQGNGMAAGGWVGMGGPEVITVGERGPEYVTPNHQLGGIGRAATGGVVLQGVSERELMDMVDRQLYFRLRRAGTGA